MDRKGGCACAQVRFVTLGDPLRVGICHCLTCRKRHGALFNAFAAFEAEQVRVEGELACWPTSEHGRQWGCGVCGSPVFWSDEREAEREVHLGVFDEPGQFTPQYEVWTIRRERWLPDFGLPGHERNRPPEATYGLAEKTR
jgi:hypothetical protein